MLKGKVIIITEGADLISQKFVKVIAEDSRITISYRLERNKNFGKV